MNIRHHLIQQYRNKWMGIGKTRKLATTINNITGEEKVMKRKHFIFFDVSICIIFTSKNMLQVGNAAIENIQ